MKRTIGIAGLGIMGSAIGANLVRAGFGVTGYDPVPRAPRSLAGTAGAARAPHPGCAGRQAGARRRPLVRRGTRRLRRQA